MNVITIDQNWEPEAGRTPAQLPYVMFDLFASLSKREYVQAKAPHRTIETSRYASNQHQRSSDDNVWVDVYDPNSRK